MRTYTLFNASLSLTIYPTDVRADRLMSVMELCGPSISTVQTRTNGNLLFAVWKKAFRDMLLALDYLHTEVNVVHGGLSFSSTTVLPSLILSWL